MSWSHHSPTCLPRHKSIKMTRFFYVAAGLLALAQSVNSVQAADLAEGEFYRPSGAEVSGLLNATTAYLRSPCPALNSMANHGYIPRDGKNLSRALIKAAIMKTFNLEDTLASSMVTQAPNVTFSLADLGKHGLIEHDVSFSRADSYLGADPSLTTPAYMKEFVALATPTLTLNKTAWLRNQRIAECKAKNPNCTYTSTEQFTANFQSALLLRVLGGQNKEEISAEYIDSFFNQEKFPADYTKPTVAIKFTEVATTSTTVGRVDTTGLTFDVVGASNTTTDAPAASSNATATTTAPTEAPKSAASAIATSVAAILTAVSASVVFML